MSGGTRRVLAVVAGVSIGVGGAATVIASAPPVTSSPSADMTGPAPDTSAADPSVAPGSAAPDGEWEQVVPGGDCQCADGAEFSFFARKADPTKVVLFFEGGGACWDATTCAFTTGEGTTYDWDIGPDESPAQQGGIFDLDAPENPFAGWSMIFVPYCTGDVHLGNSTTEYSPDLTVQHKGRVNGDAAVSYLVETFPDATDVVVAGASAGSIATPLYAGLVGDQLPEAHITVFGDGSGGYPAVPAVSAVINTAWGTMNALPDWPEAEGATVETWSIPGLWVVAGTHNPDIVMSRFDYAFDAVQRSFAALAGIPAEDLVTFMDDNEATIEEAGVNQMSYTAPGESHTLIQLDEFYAMEVDGTRLDDWLTAIVAGEEVDDVHCTDCGAPTPPPTDGG